MPDLFVFLIKVNAALLLFCAGYYLVLRHLTFYTLNRVYLVGAIVFASVYPKIDLSAFMEKHQQIARPVQVVVLNWQKPIQDTNHAVYWDWARIALWAGVVVLTIRLMVQLLSLFKLYRNSTATRINEYDVRVIDKDMNPFSFWQSIFVNPELHNPSDLNAILQHEQIHVKEWHTLDILLAELSTIFYWFNPGVWLMKRAVRENIEFITDRKILRNGADSKQYQYSLVNVSLSAAPQSIVNNFNISTIKKRIIMMNAKRSSNANITKYVFLVPAVVALLLVFSISQAAYIKNTIKANKAVAGNVLNLIADKLNISKTPVPANKPKMLSAINAKDIKAKKTVDTIKGTKFLISFNGKPDSTNLVVNGVKVSRDYVAKLDPKNINDVVVVSAGSANNLVSGLNIKYGTIFITTKDSESGKKFRERLDGGFTVKGTAVTQGIQTNDNAATVFGSLAKVSNVKVLTSTVNYDRDDDDGRLTVSSASRNPLVVTGKPWTVSIAKPDTLYLTKNDKSSGRTYQNFTVTYSVPDSAKTATLHLKGKKDSVYVVKGYTVLSNNVQFLKRSANRNSQTTIDNLSSHFIIIDGKEASQKDMKKISVDDIESVQVQSGDEATKVYGDKAKNGVLFISTKKAAKKDQ